MSVSLVIFIFQRNFKSKQHELDLKFKNPFPLKIYIKKFHWRNNPVDNIQCAQNGKGSNSLFSSFAFKARKMGRGKSTKTLLYICMYYLKGVIWLRKYICKIRLKIRMVGLRLKEEGGLKGMEEGEGLMIISPSLFITLDYFDWLSYNSTVTLPSPTTVFWLQGCLRKQ